jgi:hypothetical protein
MAGEAKINYFSNFTLSHLFIREKNHAQTILKKNTVKKQLTTTHINETVT